LFDDTWIKVIILYDHGTDILISQEHEVLDVNYIVCGKNK